MTIGQKVVIVGGGHNALITAFYLAKGGFKPLVLESREIVGGGAVTEEFHPGFFASTLAHTLGPLRPDVARDSRFSHQRSRRQAARNGTTFFFLTTEISAFCGGKKFSSIYFMASSTNCRPELRPSFRLMLSRWVSMVFTLRFSSCAIFFVPSPEPIN